MKNGTLQSFQMFENDTYMGHFMVLKTTILIQKHYSSTT